MAKGKGAKVVIHTINVYVGTQPAQPGQVTATPGAASASAASVDQLLSQLAQVLGSDDPATILSRLVEQVAGEQGPHFQAEDGDEGFPPVGERVADPEDWRDDMSIMGDAPTVAAAVDQPAAEVGGEHDEHEDEEDEEDEFAAPDLADVAGVAAGVEDEGDDVPGPGFSPMVAVDFAGPVEGMSDDLPPMSREDRLAVATAHARLVHGLDAYRWELVSTAVTQGLQELGRTSAGLEAGRPVSAQEMSDRVVDLVTQRATWRFMPAEHAHEFVQVQVEREQPAHAVLDLAQAMESVDRLDEFLLSLAGGTDVRMADRASQVRVWRQSEDVNRWLQATGAFLQERLRDPASTIPVTGPERTASVSRAWLEGVEPTEVQPVTSAG